MAEINLCDGNPAHLQSTAISNWQVINDLVATFNAASKTNVLLQPVRVSPLATTSYAVLNREYRNTFITNCRRAKQMLIALYQQLAVPVFNFDETFTYQEPIVPMVLYFDQQMINAYWQPLAADVNFISNTMNQNEIKPQ